MGTIGDTFGAPLPPAMVADFQSASEVQAKAFKGVLEFAAAVTFEARIVSGPDLSRAAQELQVSESQLLGMVRLYGNLVGPFLKEPSPQKFREELSALGLESRKAELIWSSFDSNRPLIKQLTRQAVRESFGPVIKSVRWRVDRAVSSNEPIDPEPLGIVSLTLESNTEEFDERFETNLENLDRLIQELSVLRRELAKATKPARRSTSSGQANVSE